MLLRYVVYCCFKPQFWFEELYSCISQRCPKHCFPNLQNPKLKTLQERNEKHLLLQSTGMTFFTHVFSSISSLISVENKTTKRIALVQWNLMYFRHIFYFPKFSCLVTSLSPVVNSLTNWLRKLPHPGFRKQATENTAEKRKDATYEGRNGGVMLHNSIEGRSQDGADPADEAGQTNSCLSEIETHKVLVRLQHYGGCVLQPK